MGNQISSFRSPEDAAQYHGLYDSLIAMHWPEPFEDLDVPTQFGTTRVRMSGEGEETPLLLVHPTTGSSAGWYPLIDSLSQNRRVYTPDTVGGPGRSVQAAPISSADDLATWLDETLDVLHLNRVHIVGYSEGGWIAGSHAALTKRHERITTLNGECK